MPTPGSPTIVTTWPRPRSAWARSPSRVSSSCAASHEPAQWTSPETESRPLALDEPARAKGIARIRGVELEPALQERGRRLAHEYAPGLGARAELGEDAPGLALPLELDLHRAREAADEQVGHVDRHADGGGSRIDALAALDGLP